MFSEVRKRAKKAGQPPGTPTYTGHEKDVPPQITVIRYSADFCEEKSGTQLADLLPATHPTENIWINIEGLYDLQMIDQIAQRFHLHPLTIEDILNVQQRPKVDEFDDYLFMTLKVIYKNKRKSVFTIKQISLILGDKFILSFQEIDTTLFDTIRERLKSTSNQRLRQQGTDYLMYRLVDAIIDEYFVVLETLSDQIEDTEEEVIIHPAPERTQTIYQLKRQMLLLRRAIWPMREALSHLMYTEDKLISKFTRVYLRDVYDHTVQAIDTIETFRDMLSSMLDMYLSSITNRMNEIMKTLTIITTIFIPITALASIYGMNFNYIPGLHSVYGFYITLGSMALTVMLMIFYFRLKKWF